MHASSLIEGVRCRLGPPAGTAPGAPLSLREVLERRLTDPRKPRGVRHKLSSLVSVLVAGVACGYCSFPGDRGRGGGLGSGGAGRARDAPQSGDRRL